MDLPIPAGTDNVEGSTMLPTRFKNVLMVFLEGSYYNLVFEPPAADQIRYDRAVGRFTVPNTTEADRTLTAIIKK